MKETYNFREEPYDYIYPQLNESEFKDYRNEIMCVHPTVDWECYFNYLELLENHKNKWKSFGYLDLGMMPVVMGPSFMHEALMRDIVPRLEQIKRKHPDLKYYYMAPVAFFKENVKLSFKDIWMFREDAAKVMNGGTKNVSAIEFLRWCLNEFN